jgi:hypothetical protein
MPNCKLFPVDYRDIRDRNAVSNNACGYHFESNVNRLAARKQKRSID